MAAPRSPWPQRTTAWAGSCLAVAAALQLLVALDVTVPLLKTFVVPLRNPGTVATAAVLVGLGFTLAAVGVGREIGVAGRSPLGVIALLVYGVGPLAQKVLDLASVPVDAPSDAVVIAGTALSALTTASGLVGAVGIVRARVLHGPARWALLPLASFGLLLTLLLTADPALWLAIASLPLELIEPLLLLVLAVAFLLFGRAEAVRHRLRVARDAW